MIEKTSDHPRQERPLLDRNTIPNPSVLKAMDTNGYKLMWMAVNKPDPGACWLHPPLYLETFSLDYPIHQIFENCITVLFLKSKACLGLENSGMWKTDDMFSGLKAAVPESGWRVDPACSLLQWVGGIYVRRPQGPPAKILRMSSMSFLERERCCSVMMLLIPVVPSEVTERSSLLVGWVRAAEESQWLCQGLCFQSPQINYLLRMPLCRAG